MSILVLAMVLLAVAAAYALLTGTTSPRTIAQFVLLVVVIVLAVVLVMRVT